MDNKKGELSITMIILVVLGLVVLAVLVYLVVQSGGDYKDATACVKAGGACKITNSDPTCVNLGPGLCGTSGNKECCSITGG